MELLPSEHASDGDDVGGLAWILVPLIFVAGAAVGATAWALRPLIRSR